MRKAAFFLVDVFSDRPLEGNPLAVVPDADQIDEATMRRIAREFNQAETTFLSSSTSGQADRRLRSFTPAGHEVFGAGHNALGAWWWLASSGRLPASGDSQQFHQQIGDSVLPVTVFWKDGEVASIEMRQSAPVFGKTVSDSGALADALGLTPADMVLDGLEAQVVSTGAAHLLVPVKDRSAIEKARPDTAKLLSVLRAAEGEGCYLFCLDSRSLGRRRMRGSSTQRWGLRKMQPQGLLPARWLRCWWRRESPRTRAAFRLSRVTRWTGRV